MLRCWSTWATIFEPFGLVEEVGLCVWEDDLGFEVGCLLGSHLRVGHNDDDVAHLAAPGCGSVETDVARAGSAGDCVGFEALSVVVVDYIDVLACDYAGCLHEERVDGEASYVVEACIGDVYSVYF